MFPGCEITINKDNMAYFENVGLYRYMIDDYGYRGELVDNIEDYSIKQLMETLNE